MIMRIAKLVVPLLILAVGGVAASQSFDAVVYTAAFNAPPYSGGIHFLDMATGKVTGTEEARFGRGSSETEPRPVVAEEMEGRVKSRGRLTDVWAPGRMHH